MNEVAELLEDTADCKLQINDIVIILRLRNRHEDQRQSYPQ